MSNRLMLSGFLVMLIPIFIIGIRTFFIQIGLSILIFVLIGLLIFRFNKDLEEN